MIAYSPKRVSEPLRAGTDRPLIILAIATDAINPGNVLEISARAIGRTRPAVYAGEFHALVKPPEGVLEKMLAEPDKATEMHSENGLLEELITASELFELSHVDACLANWIDSLGSGGDAKSPIIHHAPDWLAKWLNASLPATRHRIFTYKQIDLRSIYDATDRKMFERDGRTETDVFGLVEMWREAIRA